MTISLEKRTENAQGAIISLLKKEQARGNDLGELTAQVVLALDFSGSMDGRYRNREVQDLVERALALSLSGLDDDGDIQTFFFHDGVFPPEVVNERNYQGFVDRWTRGKRMGATDYLPCIRSIRQYLAKNGMTRPGQPPVLVLFVTDGATANERKIQQELVNASGDPVFWQFMGLGYSPAFLEHLDTMGGRVLDNVGLFDVNNSQRLSDEEFYGKTIDEFFSKWLPAARAKGIVTS
ncbi:VWA domain-containing protein [Candidatus Saccharibacteria bacterium]|nr:VWA domain-containing protein [Candidatus Saccharibacteria bacterium]